MPVDKPSIVCCAVCVQLSFVAFGAADPSHGCLPDGLRSGVNAWRGPLVATIVLAVAWLDARSNELLLRAAYVPNISARRSIRCIGRPLDTHAHKQSPRRDFNIYHN